MEQQRDAEGWKPWQLHDTSQQLDQQDKGAQEQQAQLRPGVTGSLEDGQKFGLASTIKTEWEEQKQQTSPQLSAHNASSKASTQQSWPYGQKLRAPAKALSLELGFGFDVLGRLRLSFLSAGCCPFLVVSRVGGMYIKMPDSDSLG